MFYRSTRGSSEKINCASAIIKGIAGDKGLFVPDYIPKLDLLPYEMVGLSYHDIAIDILSKFFPDMEVEEIRECVLSAYDDKFSDEEIVPLSEAGGAWFMELYHGKTAAFKDMALSILPHLMTLAIKKEGEERTIAILTATSGDTGKAALEGFSDVPGTEIFVFYPSDGVSKIQKRQMTTQEGKNTHVFGIHGNFDDAQTEVKRIFNDKEVNKALSEKGYLLSSANSINIGRLIPQIVYYVYSYVKLIEKGEIAPEEEINIVVPTGNFGNILAAYYAGQMGIPVNCFICASNVNHVLTDFINTGIYNANRPLCLTNSPSMDILVSSNLERLLYHLSNGSEEEIYNLMSKLETDRFYEVNSEIKQGLEDFYAGFADDNETLKTIETLYKEEGYLVDTHTAVGYKVYQDYIQETSDNTVTLIASTASGYKFAEDVNQALGIKKSEDGFEAIKKLHRVTGVEIPEGLKELDKKEILHEGLIEKDEMLSAIEKNLK